MPEVLGGGPDKRALYQQVATIHCQSINQGFLPTLGEQFLALLYESIDADPNSILFIAQAEGRVVGFVAGGRGMGSIYRQMLKRWPRLLAALFPALLSPVKLNRVFEIIWFSRKQKPVLGCPAAELFSIAVLGNMRRSGVAQSLYRELAERFFREGEKAFCIVVGESLVAAHHFYLRMGAEPMAKICVHQGQMSTLYRHDLPISI